MTRMFSTFALAGWTGYHAVRAFSLAAPVASAGGAVPPSAALTAVVHAMLAIGALGAAAMLQSSSERRRGEALALVVLAAGIALSAAVFLAGGPGGGSAGVYAFAVALTLLAFTFDRLVGSQGTQDEVDHEAFMRYAAELGAEMGRAAETPERGRGARR